MLLNSGLTDLNANKLSTVDGQRKIIIKEQNTNAGQEITTESQKLYSSDFTINGSYIAIYKAHVTFESSAKNSKVYWQIGNLYMQGYEIWDGTVRARRTIDIFGIGKISGNVTIDLNAFSESVTSSTTMFSIGNNTSLNRYQLILIPV